MKAVIISLLVAFAIASTHPVNRDIVQQVLDAKTTWTPMDPETNPFAYMSVEQIKAMLGTKVSQTDSAAVDLEGLLDQDNFDSRERWPGFVHGIMNQGQCGSCWAFGATEAMSDRLAIVTKGSVNVVLSPQYLVSCDKNNMGCSGGWLDKAWNFMMTNGVPSQSCVSYKSGGGSSGTCPSKCDDGSPIVLYKCKNIQYAKNAGQIQSAIMRDGPVEAAFTVYQDFLSYKSGIYKHVSGGILGGHAIKAVGWGVDKGTKYWIMANSWGTSWGEQGFFKIAFGECGIEQNIVFAEAVEPKAESE